MMFDLFHYYVYHLMVAFWVLFLQVKPQFWRLRSTNVLGLVCCECVFLRMFLRCAQLLQELWHHSVWVVVLD